MTNKSIFVIVSTFLLIDLSSSLDKCTNPSSTLYDGYLDSQIYHANFDKTQNAYLNLTNPFFGINPLNSLTVAFWARFPQLQSEGLFPNGTLIDCSDAITVNLTNGNISYYVLQNSTATSTSKNNGSLISTQTTSNLQNWQSYAFSFATGTQYLFVNGQVQSQLLYFQSLTASTTTCMISNSQNLKSPLNSQMRHLIFLKTAWTSSTNVTNLIHHQFLPTDSNLLSYFIFDQQSQFQESYYFNTSRSISYQGVTLQTSSLPEFVCYCTGNYPNFMNVTNAFTLKPFVYSSLTNNVLDNSGFIFQIQIFASNFNSKSGDILLYNFSNYALLQLTNNSNTLRLDLYSSTNQNVPSANLSFKNYRFRFNFWTSITITLSKTAATLSIDGVQTDSVSHSITLPSTSTQLQMMTQPQISYLLSNLTLRNQKVTGGQLMLNFSFTQNNLNSENLTMLQNSSSVLFGSSNSYCNSTNARLQNYWTGSSCSDQRLYPLFKGQNSTYLQVSLPSTNSNMTIELWVRDLNTLESQTQVLFENSFDGLNPLIQLGIQTNSTSQRGFFCYPAKSTNPSVSLQLVNVTTYNVWHHISCQSNALTNQILLTLFNSTTQQMTTLTQKGTSFMDGVNFNLITTIGSRIDGSLSFTGLIREFRIWQVARSADDLKMQRFQALDPSLNTLLYYLRFSDTINPLSIPSLAMNTNALKEKISMTSPTIQWQQDKDLVICSQGLFYDGQCCSQYNISTVNLIFNATTANTIVVYLNSSTMSNQWLSQYVKANFTVTSVGNNINYTSNVSYLTYLQSIFNQNNIQSFSVNSNLIQPLVYSITLTAAIFSDYLPNQVSYQTKTLILTCPMIYLNILPNYVTDQPQIVSLNSTDKSPIINSTMYLTCYNATTKTTVVNTFSSMLWTLNNSAVVTKLFNVSSDQQSLVSLTNKTSTITTPAAQYQQVNAKMIYNSKFSVQNSIYLNYQSLLLITGLSTNNLNLNILFGSNMLVDLSRAASFPTTLPLLFQIQCPTSLFANTSQYQSLCQYSSTTAGLFNLDTSLITAVANYNYAFSFNVTIQGTSVFQVVSANVVFYKDGGLTNCPRVTLPSMYLANIQSQQVLQIIPDPYLYCIGTFYQVSTVNWTVTDVLYSKSYTSILSYGNQTIYASANITPSALSKVPSGALLNVVVTYNTISSTTKQAATPSIATTSIQLSQTPLVVNIDAYNNNKVKLTNNTLNFTEQTLILNASRSYDPDDSAASLSYLWICPPQIEQYYTCASLTKGSQNQFLYLNALQRAKALLQYNIPYNFTVIVTSLSNGYKNSQQANISIIFSPPTKNDSRINTQMTPICDNLTAISGTLYNLSSTFQKVIRYDVSNYTNSWFLLQTNTTTTCKLGNATDQLMMFYIFDGFYSNTYQPLQKVFEQNITTSGGIKNSTNTSFNASTAIDLLSVVGYQMYQVNIYWLTTRQNSSDVVYMNVETIYLYRQMAQLVASIVTPKFTIDKYSNLIINGSSSYDPEPIIIGTVFYTYKWTCPATSLNCLAQNSSILTIPYINRTQSSVNNNATTYNYTLQMFDNNNRTSNNATASITINQLNNYSYCIQISLMQQYLNSYSAENNQTLYLQYNQSMPLTLNASVVSMCNNLNIEKFAFDTQASQQQFWTTDASNQYGITLVNTQFMKVLSSRISSPILFKQSYSMGLDTSIKYNATSYINVILTQPDLIVAIYGPKISYFSSTNQQVILDASSSNDPSGLPITFSWDCPSYFGGSSCSTSARLTLDYNSLLGLTNQNIQQYYDQSHQFTLTITSQDKQRVSSKTYYLYLADSSKNGIFIQSGIETCGIFLKNDSGAQVIPFFQQQIFQFSCPTNGALTTSLTSANNLVWSIDSLTYNVDYFYANNQLFLNPYIGAKLNANGFTDITISLTFTNQIVNPIKTSFTFVYNQLNYSPSNPQGSQYVLANPTDQFTFNESYSLTFNGFQSLKGFGLQVQLRSYSTILKSYQITKPLVPMTDPLINIFYSSLILSKSSSLYFDFFDMNLNYLGSYNLQANNFSSLQTGSMMQSTFESQLYSLCLKQANSYNTSSLYTLYQYIEDLTNVRTLAQEITFNVITIDPSSTSTLSDYAVYPILYVVNTMPVMLTYFPQSASFYLSQGRYVIEKKSIDILTFMASIQGVNYQNLINQVLIVLEQIQQDYSQIILVGDDQAIFRQNIISIISATSTQLQYLISASGGSNTTTQSYQNRLTALNTWIVGVDFQNLQKGQFSSTIQGNINKIALVLDTSTTNPIKLQSQINNFEQVQLLNQQQLNTYGINSLEVSYTNRDNSTSPSNTVLFIDGYDSNYNIINFNMNQQQSSSSSRRVLQQNTYKSVFDYVFQQQQDDSQFLKKSHIQLLDSTSSNNLITFTIQAKLDYLKKFQSTLNDNSSQTYLYPVCVYYDSSANQWSTQGLTNLSYNYDTGILNCSTTHFSEFSMDYITLTKSSSGNTKQDQNNTNITTNSNYFQAHLNQYYLGVGVSAFITILTVLISCKSFTEWDANRPMISQDDDRQISCCGAFKATCSLHHLILSAIIGPSKASIHLTLPKVSKMIDMWWLFYAILATIGLTLWQLPQLEWTSKFVISSLGSNTTQEIKNEFKDYKNNMILCGIIMGSIIIGRIFVLTIGYMVYFIGKGPDMDIKGMGVGNSKQGKSKNITFQDESERGTDLEDNLIKKSKKKSGDKKKKKKRSQQLREENNFEMEGGSSEDEIKQKNKSKKSKSKQKNKTGKSKEKKSGKQDMLDMIEKEEKVNQEKVKLASGGPSISSSIYSQPQSKNKVYTKQKQQKPDQVVQQQSNLRDKLNSMDEQESAPYPEKKNHSSVDKNFSKQPHNNKQDLFIEDNQYNKSKKNNKMSRQIIQVEDYKPVKQFKESPISEEYKYDDEEGGMKQKKKKKKKGTKKGGSRNASPVKQMHNFGIQNMSTKINSSIDEYTSQDEKTTEKKKKSNQKKSAYSTGMDLKVDQADTEYMMKLYSKSKWITLAIKFVLLLGCMGITYWMMWLLTDLSHLYAWLAMTGVIFFIWTLIISPIFIALYSLFFKVTGGQGICLKIATVILLGNVHSNVEQGIIYNMSI